ncbi:MAG: peptidase M16 [Candidatus Omnitrophica bacterium CG12_big_fil_rev_8_21_14_0_65_43_15]|uniref:Peptidase M16 n=1 Tax=Candidatus Taenaricola geysiri TaxID=1974752 RepID=A0A2J0LFL1_9BACT|nr:MAG: hypothetical protein AUJ89_00295 [Candidatus Omnitrophica bacterium CG1_02_43_210]PIV11589.1 MAG: peptidase M16 [Candidatus Omnitrophica bacterium CG03_land_8_20_14_0_80_43_22]PIW66631.1 MAG: peptidase M16 [Candidatus Omnitrophica bacterium CG12_big_fil_rev_8_21_14_0_65_43_15]PIY83417.1 MAG: peptidase M16 [Candidatus Omnitrophica bacterium CG_4_10_14_0_8_um_filter_43_18]PJC45877.1 MAG: peptidase M16 [Candidatus Omnitrophica bacterium CG_4_9_14_0_2_um_filter_43_12]
MYQITVLDNGLKIATVHMPSMQSLSLGFWVKAGGRYENKNNSGISHFLEHLLFEETKNRTSQEIKQAIEGVGGSLNGFTGEESTCYLVKILSRHLDMSADVLSDMLLNAALSETAIKKERSVIREEIKMYMDLPGQYVSELLAELMWPDHPLGMFLTGTLDSVNAIKRPDLVDYKGRFYAPGNIVIAAAGPLGHDAIVKACSKYFSVLPVKDKVSFEPVTEVQKAVRINLKQKDTEQMHIALGMHAVSSDDPDRFAMNILHIMLGANMSSRFFQEVREKRGLAYEISSSLKKYRDTGAFIVHGGIKNEKFSEAIKVILEELKKIKNKPPAIEELKRAKEFYSGQLLMALEDTLDHMLWLGEQVLMRERFLNSAEILKNIEHVVPEDISRVAAKFFKSEKLNLAAIGPVTNKDKKEIPEILEILG